jgi:uncharacterized protein YyaL (SSP411 family)
MDTTDFPSSAPDILSLSFRRFVFAAGLALGLAVGAGAQGAVPVAANAAGADAGVPIHWVSWSDAVFQQAREEHKFVLLDLEAVWCHWCHVMDAVTYVDQDVRRLMAEKYIAVKVDQDSRPDISNRYEDYGWPATVVFDGDGKEIVKRQGYLPPKPMASMLQAIIDDPTPGPSVVAEEPVTYAAGARASAALVARVRRNYEAQYDVKAEGWGFSHKYLDADSAEYALTLARAGDVKYATRLRKTLKLEEKIQDPAWGGAYQYSAGGDWDEPHFEKLIAIQAAVMRTYSLAYAWKKDPSYLATAESVNRYVKGFLTSPEGAFYVSQDADLVEGEHGGEYFKLGDAARRAKGIPRVDKHLYARENGWMIAALAELYAVGADKDVLAEAERAAEWVMANRSSSSGGAGGGFMHGEHDLAGPFLGDTLAMGQAFLALYQVTADAKWLDRATATLPYVEANFSGEDKVGFVTSKAPTDKYSHGVIERDENVALARFANLVYQDSGDRQAQEIAGQAMRYLVTPAIAVKPLSAGTLLAIEETGHAPLHVAVVGAKGDSEARKLFDAALREIRGYERIEWITEPGVHGDVSYPNLTKAAAFVCREGSCGEPVYSEEALMARIGKAPGMAVAAVRKAAE